MKTQFKIILTICFLFLSAYVCNIYAYSISTSGKTIIVEMKHPTIGIVGFNAVDWSDDPDEIGEDIFENFVGFFDSSKKGLYTVKVYWIRKDEYGKKRLDYAGSYSFEAEELRKYENYYYSKRYRNVGEIISKMAFR